MYPKSEQQQVVVTLPNLGEEDSHWVEIAGMTLAKLFGEALGQQAVYMERDEETGEAVIRITVILTAHAETEISASVASTLINLVMLLRSGLVNEDVTVQVDGDYLEF
jgi:hypothetical protein